MNKDIVIIADQYDRIDGINAYLSNFKRLTLSTPTLEINENMKIAAQIWQETANGELEMSTELPLHQVLDLMILLSRTLLYFREAYRLPLLYNPENPTVERMGVQGGVLPVVICTENPNINEDIQRFSQALNDMGEMIGERLRVLSQILEGME